jgi:hypothetical protein
MADSNIIRKTGYSPEWYGSNGTWQGYLRLKYEASCDLNTNKTTVKLTPQFMNDTEANFGNSYYMFDGTGTGNGGIYANGQKIYSLSTEYGGHNNYLSCGSANGEWANFDKEFTFVVNNDDQGRASFTIGAYGSIICNYLAPREFVPFTPDDEGGTGAGGGGSSSTNTYAQAVVSPIGAIATSTITLTFYTPCVVSYEVDTIDPQGQPYHEDWSESVPSNGKYKITLREPAIIFDNREFDGWSTNPNDSDAQYLPGDIVQINRNLTLYPVWYIVYSGTGSTVHIRKNGTWVPYNIYIRKNGAWVPYKAYIRRNGVWVSYE